MSKPREAVSISVLSAPGEPVRVVLTDADGGTIEATMKPRTFERIWDRIGEAMALADAKGIGAITETWGL